MSITIEDLTWAVYHSLKCSLNETIKDFLAEKIITNEVFYDDKVQFSIKGKEFDGNPKIDLESIQIDRNGCIRFSARTTDSELIIKLGNLTWNCKINYAECDESNKCEECVECNEYKNLRILTMHTDWKKENCGG